MANMQRGRRRVDPNVYTNALFGEQPVEILASAVNSQYGPTASGFVRCSPSNIFDKPSLFKHFEHAVLHARSHPARLVVPLCLSGSWIRFLVRPPLVWSLAVRPIGLAPYASLANEEPWPGQLSQG